jgi:NAD(P)H-quinone oxidoreductase subunit N
VGEVQRVMPLLGVELEGQGPILLWLLEGQVLSTAELASLVGLTRREPRFKVVVEMGGSRALRWQPLEQLVVGV